MKFLGFQVWNYRNIKDSGFIDVGDITAFVGQNEAGKSNLFEALYRINPFDSEARYSIEEDWPVDKWGERDDESLVCSARFDLDKSDVKSLFDYALESGQQKAELPDKIILEANRWYKYDTDYSIEDGLENILDTEKVNKWAEEHVPKFVYIHDYEMSGAQMELNQLQQRKRTVKWDDLTADEQTIITVLDLAKIDLDDFVEKGQSKDGRTIRSFDKRSASSYLTKQFQDLWRQKNVRFDIDVDATTLNIFVEDESVGMPVRLNRRSTGFRWYVAFAWKFTHASNGQFKNCILLLEEPGIHLHYSAQHDLLEVFERLKATNSILYTTHLASMVDLGFPERIRIVENHSKGAVVKAGLVSSQPGPMAVIEMSLGLTGNMNGLLGTRKTLIVEGGDDAIMLNKLSGVLKASGEEAISDSIYLWPAKGASKTPMYAAFAIGQKWQSGVLLDSDEAGMIAKQKIQELYLDKLSAENSNLFRILMIGDAAGINKTDAAIEELFPDEFYIELVNEAYRVSIKPEDLPKDGSDMITKRIDHVLKSNYSQSLDKARILNFLLKRFDSWNTIKDLPKGTATKAKKLFGTINKAFGITN